MTENDGTKFQFCWWLKSGIITDECVSQWIKASVSIYNLMVEYKLMKLNIFTHVLTPLGRFPNSVTQILVALATS